MITDIRAFKRDVYGWQGAHGEAYTITGRLPTGKRKTLKTIKVGCRVLLCAESYPDPRPHQPWRESYRYTVELTGCEYIDLIEKAK